MSDINLNTSECIVKTSNFGETIVTNICSGNVVTVPWGTLQYFGTSVAFIASLAVFIFIIIVVTMLVMTYREG